MDYQVPFLDSEGNQIGSVKVHIPDRYFKSAFREADEDQSQETNRNVSMNKLLLSAIQCDEETLEQITGKEYWTLWE